MRSAAPRSCARKADDPAARGYLNDDRPCGRRFYFECEEHHRTPSTICSWRTDTTWSGRHRRLREAPVRRRHRLPLRRGSTPRHHHVCSPSPTLHSQRPTLCSPRPYRRVPTTFLVERYEHAHRRGSASGLRRPTPSRLLGSRRGSRSPRISAWRWTLRSIHARSMCSGGSVTAVPTVDGPTPAIRRQPPPCRTDASSRSARRRMEGDDRTRRYLLPEARRLPN